MRSGSWTLLAVCFGLTACGEAAPVTGGPFGGDGSGDGTLTTDGASSSDGNSQVPDGDADGSSTGGDGGPEICMPSAEVPFQLVPDMLIVLDRSGSMNDNNRWNASVSALEAVTAQLDTRINFGLMAFPGRVDCNMLSGFEKSLCEFSSGLGIGVGSSCEAGSLIVPVGPGTAQEISSQLAEMGPDGNTPTSASLEAAGQLLGEYVPAPDEAVRPKYVLLVTDGEPNCVGGRDDDGAAVQASVAAVEALTAKGIKTYVIGYQTQGIDAMDLMAAAGGTGSDKHIPVENEQQLVDALNAIAGKAVSCTYNLNTKPDYPENVLVKVDGQEIFQQNGEWTFSEDGLQVIVQGERCEQLQSPGTHVLTVDILCHVVVPF